MLNVICNFTCKSLGVAVVVTEFKLEVSDEVSNSIKSLNHGNNQPTRGAISFEVDDDNNKVRLPTMTITCMLTICVVPPQV